jgi:hypothetical protein
MYQIYPNRIKSQNLGVSGIQNPGALFTKLTYVNTHNFVI